MVNFNKYFEIRLLELVDEYRWRMKKDMDNDEAFNEIYYKADQLAEEINMDREDFFNKYFN